MKASIVDGWPKGNEIKILIEGTDAAQVNALRRAIMADVPKMAISKVTVSYTHLTLPPKA